MEHKKALAEISLLGGCNFIKTDLPAEMVDAETVPALARLLTYAFIIKK